MGNLALHSAEEPDNLRAITGTVEVPTERDNDAALVLGARPIIQHQPAARHISTSIQESRGRLPERHRHPPLQLRDIIQVHKCLKKTLKKKEKQSQYTSQQQFMCRRKKSHVYNTQHILC